MTRPSWWGWARDLVGLRCTGFDLVDAVRAASCAGGTVLIGWWAGDVPAGLTASIGAFTALYGGRRPYRFRARQLAAVALAFAVAATALCQVVDTGPPGAYMFVLACATASGIPGATAEPWRLGLLVLAGGALSWCAHMIGIVAGPAVRRRRRWRPGSPRWSSC